MTKATAKAIEAINETLDIDILTPTDKAILDVLDILKGDE